MRQFLVKTAAVGLGLASMHAQAATNACDKSWNGGALSAQLSANGHVVAVLGADRQIRLNEYMSSSKTWRGWTVLQNLDPGSQYANVWVQTIANPQTPFAAQNIYAVDLTSKVKQWICNSTQLGISNGDDWKCYKAPYVISAINGTSQITGRVVSAQMDNSTQWGGKQYLFATFTDGTIKYRTWTPNGNIGGNWDLNWTEMGLSSVQSAPYPFQVSNTQVDLFARRSDATIWHRVSTNGTWGSWIQLPATMANGTAALATTGELSVHAVGTKIYLSAFNTSGVLQYQYSTNGGATWSGWNLNGNAFSTSPGSLAAVGTPTFSRRYGIGPDMTIRQLEGLTGSDVNCILPTIDNRP